MVATVVTGPAAASGGSSPPGAVAATSAEVRAGWTVPGPDGRRYRILVPTLVDAMGEDVVSLRPGGINDAGQVGGVGTYGNEMGDPVVTERRRAYLLKMPPTAGANIAPLVGGIDSAGRVAGCVNHGYRREAARWSRTRAELLASSYTGAGERPWTDSSCVQAVAPNGTMYGVVNSVDWDAFTTITWSPDGTGGRFSDLSPKQVEIVSASNRFALAMEARQDGRLQPADARVPFALYPDGRRAAFVVPDGLRVLGGAGVSPDGRTVVVNTDRGAAWLSRSRRPTVLAGVPTVLGVSDRGVLLTVNGLWRRGRLHRWDRLVQLPSGASFIPVAMNQDHAVAGYFGPVDQLPKDIVVLQPRW